MTTAVVFSIANMIAMPMWVLMIFLPKWKPTRFLVDYKVVPLFLSIIYAIYVIISIRAGNGFDYGSLESVMTLFTKEDAVLAGWVHYLVFDLLIGMWILDQNQRVKIHQLIMSVCLFLTFMFGPIGFLLFTSIKTLKNKQS